MKHEVQVKTSLLLSRVFLLITFFIHIANVNCVLCYIVYQITAYTMIHK